MQEVNYQKYPGELAELWQEILNGYPQDSKLHWYEKLFKRHLIYSNLLNTHEIKPRGMIYLGANTGQLLWTWILLGFTKVLMAEPQPDKFGILERQTKLAQGILKARDQFTGPATIPELMAFQCAINCESGVADLYVMSNSNLTSLLEPNEPLIKELTKNSGVEIKLSQTLKVPTYSLDNLIIDCSKRTLEAFNFLYMNIQGSELNALKGGQSVLQYLDFILLEVNFCERYYGCPGENAIKDFLHGFGFLPVWGHRAADSGFMAFKR